MITIRPLQDADKTEWLRMRKALWPEDTVDELEQNMIDIFGHQVEQPVFVAERPGGGLCGFVEVSIHAKSPGCKTDRIGYLEAWYVDEDWRKQGVGRTLVEVAEGWARSVGCLEMASDTTPDYPVSPNAHVALGYKETERYYRKVLD